MSSNVVNFCNEMSLSSLLVIGTSLLVIGGLLQFF